MATKETSIKSGSRPKMIDERNVGAGVFSNIVNLSVSPREIVLDFGLVLPGQIDEASLMSRVFLTKEHALELRDVLNRSLKVYDDK